MDKAVDIMQRSNNYERRKLVDTFSKPIIKDMDQLIDDTVMFKFDINEECKNNMENYVEFNKNYNEPNFKFDMNKFIKLDQYEYKLYMTYDLTTKQWSVKC